jgi:GTP-binding protein
MVDGVVLVVDANEGGLVPWLVPHCSGAMAQTKYVLQKALKSGLRAVVVLNKVDRPGALNRISAVESELFDLFALHMVDDAQLEYPTLYASARMGWSRTSMKDITDVSTIKGDMQALFDAILTNVPAPKGSRDDPFSFLVTQLEANTFLGKCVIGKVHTGRVRVGDNLVALDKDNVQLAENRVTKLFIREGLEQVWYNNSGIASFNA